MPTAFTHFVFVDFENVPNVDLARVAGRPVHITLLIGKKQTRLALSLVRQIHQLASQVELVEVGASGRNALDLTLAFYLGQAVERAPHAEYHIVSGDSDFDAMVGHLQGKGAKVSRQKNFADLPFLASGKPAPAAVTRQLARAPAPARPVPKTDKFDKFVLHLRNSPPANRTKLEHMIEAFFKPSLPAGGKRGVINKLLERAVISIDAAGKVNVRGSGDLGSRG